MLTVLRLLLFPFTLIYACIIYLRNKLYDIGVLKSQKHTDVYTIVIGNLAIGGTGKSPTLEYLVRLLKNYYKLATLSRGYGRKTKGFLHVHTDSSVREVGDEPLQFKKKFPQLTVAVCENRNQGIEQLKKDSNIIILDDAFQHRKLTPDFAILLFDYNSLLTPIIPLPTGNFRDIMSQSQRAQLILVTKAPKENSNSQREEIKRKIRKYSQAPIFFSKIKYGELMDPLRLSHGKISNIQMSHILLLTGIANPSPLYNFLSESNHLIYHLSYRDHYDFQEKDYEVIRNTYHKLPEPRLIITTEKDIQRINTNLLIGIPIYYIPIQIYVEDYITFKEQILTAISQKITTQVKKS